MPTSVKKNNLKKGRFLVNVVSNVVNFLLTALIGIWFTPYLIRNLGIAAFGLIALALSLTSYLNIFTLIINSALGRFITIAFAQDNHDESKRIFNTSFFGTIFIIVILIIPTYWLSYKISGFIKIPIGYVDDFRVLFIFTIATFMIMAVRGVFQISSFASNRFDLRNLVEISSVLSKIAIVVIFFKLATPKIWHVGAGIMFSGILSLVLAILVCHYLTPDLIINIKKFDFLKLKNMVNMGSWIFVSQIGTILLINIDLLVTNVMFGAEASGRYASIIQWSGFIRSFSMVIAGVFTPTILYYYAKNNIPELIKYSKQAVKFLGLLIALPIALLCGFSKPLLQVWLGDSFISLAPLMFLTLIHLCINLGYLPLHNISIATNNVKVPGIVQIIIGILNLFLALFLAGPIGWGMYGIAAAGGIVLLIRNLIFTPLYAAFLLKQPYYIFLKEVLPISIATFILSLICWSITLFFNLASFGHLIVAGIIISFLYIISVIIFLTDKNERTLLLDIIRFFPKRKVEVV